MNEEKNDRFGLSRWDFLKSVIYGAGATALALLPTRNAEAVTATWNSATGYIWPSNVVDSGNTSFRIYNAGYTQIGPVPSHTDSFGILGGIQLQLSCASSTAKPAVWIERTISANTSLNTYVTTGLQVTSTKLSGNYNVEGLYSEILYSGGTGDCVAVGGWALSNVSNDGVWGGWFRATGASASCKVIGVEVNLEGHDGGYSSFCNAGNTIGFLAATVPSGNHQTSAFFAGTQDNVSKWHIGVNIAPTSIVPGYPNAGICIHGAQTYPQNAYNGIYMPGKDTLGTTLYLGYGLEMSEANFLYNIAIHLGGSHLIIWGTGVAGQLGGNLYLDANGRLTYYNNKNGLTTTLSS